MRIDYYTSASGHCPILEYFTLLDARMASKTMRSIALLREFGNRLGQPDAKYLKDGIFELRTQMGGNSGRVLFFFFDGNTAILTHGFLKKTRKTPQREIDRALRYKEDYMSRRGQ